MELVATSIILATLYDLLDRHSDEVTHSLRHPPRPEKVAAVKAKFTLFLSRYAQWPKPAYIHADNTGSVDITWDTDGIEIGLTSNDDGTGLDWCVCDMVNGSGLDRSLDASKAGDVQATYDELVAALT